MSTDSTLQKFEEKMLKQVSPLETKSLELLKKATGVTIKDNGSLAKAVAVKKEINIHGKLIKDSRMALTRPLDDMKKLIMSKENEVTLPLEEAKSNVSEKILAHEEELERIRQVEQERIDAILEKLSVSVWSLETPAEVDAKGKAVKKAFVLLSTEDQNNAEVKLAFRQSVDALTTRKTNLEEEERQRVERERLEKEAAKQDAARAKLDRERAAIDAEERRIQAEKERQQRELERQALEEDAAKQRKAEAAAEKARPKSNIATRIDFEIADPNLVERMYCSPDPVKIRQAIKNGVINIGGVRLFETKTVR